MNNVQFKKNFESVQASLYNETLSKLEEKLSVCLFTFPPLKQFARLKVIYDFISQTSKRNQIIIYHFLLNVPKTITRTVTSLSTKELEEECLSIFYELQRFIESYSFDTITLKLDAFCSFARHVCEETNDMALVYRYNETLGTIRILRRLTKNILARE